LAFPTTHRSAVLGVRSDDPEVRSRALDRVAQVYWRPVFRHLRSRWRVDDDVARDLVQGFFAAALHKGWLERFDPTRGRFRTFLLSCLDAYAANEARAARRLKRGGGTVAVPLEVVSAEGEVEERPLASAFDLEADFHREWVRSLFALAVEALRERSQGTSREAAFTLFQRYDLEGSDAPERPSYRRLAEELGLPETQVTNHLHWARKEFRSVVLATLREITASEEEFRSEARTLLGVDPA
jgi:RNA polymerase sigma-70 factor (ECF subfamily)